MHFKNAEKVADQFIRNSTKRGGNGFRKWSSKTNGGSKNRMPVRKGDYLAQNRIAQARSSTDDLMIAAGVFEDDADVIEGRPPARPSFTEEVDRLNGRLTNWQRHKLDRSGRDRRNPDVVLQFLSLEKN